MISREEMYAKILEYSYKIKDLITRSDVPDKEVFDAMCCSPYSEDEWTGFKATVESATYGIQEFIYKGFTFSITAVMNKERFVCWIEQRKSKGYLERAYLVPGAWVWGTRVDEKDIETIFLPSIDKYLQEVGEDNIQ